MHGLVGCCYVPCDDDDESQGFVPVAGRCTTLRRDDESQGFVLAFWAPAAALFQDQGTSRRSPPVFRRAWRGGCGWNAATASEESVRSGAFYMP